MPKENTLEEVKEEPVEQPAKSVKKSAVKKVKAEKPANETTEEPKKTNHVPRVSMKLFKMQLDSSII